MAKLESSFSIEASNIDCKNFYYGILFLFFSRLLSTSQRRKVEIGFRPRQTMHFQKAIETSIKTKLMRLPSLVGLELDLCFH